MEEELENSMITIEDDSEFNIKIEKLRETKEIARKKITVLKDPITALTLFTQITWHYIIECLIWLRGHRRTFVVLLSPIIIYIIASIPGAHQQYIQDILYSTSIGLYWIFLGVLSSIGLGTGLHTFVLYLGPHIAKVTLVAHECLSVDFLAYGEDSFICVTDGIGVPTFWQLLKKVQLDAFLWGVGTALGELPPYFVARAARLAGQDITEFNFAGLQNETGFFGKLKKAMVEFCLGRYGFIGIMLFASIPNPLFDLAGIICGHFLVPWWKFFFATFIGKAIIKANIQTIFVITLFSQARIDTVVAFLERILPFLKGKINKFLEKEKLKLHRTSGSNVATTKSIFARIWDVVLLVMILYFVISIINSTVLKHLEKKDESIISEIITKRSVAKQKRRKSNTN